MRSDQLSMTAMLLAAVIMTSTVGCGGSKQPPVHVVGKVTLDGKPVSEVEVHFSSNAPGTVGKIVRTHSASVVDGAFEFPKTKGIPAGEYELIVRPVEPDAEVVVEQVRSKDKQLLKNRDSLNQAIQKKGKVNVTLDAKDTNVVSIELSSR